MRRLTLLLGACLAMAACGSDAAGPDAAPADAPSRPAGDGYALDMRVPNTTCKLEGSPDLLPALQTEAVFPPNFAQPLYLTSAPDGTDNIYVVEKAGVIRVFSKSAPQTRNVFVNITSRVLSAGSEQGLLSVAFHPNYAQNGFFYVDYITPGAPATAEGHSIIARYHASGGVGDPNSELVLLDVPQPFTNHNGGQLQFGPDGMLYITFGDGGSANDPGNRAQDKSVVFGKVLRIDVDHPQGMLQYGIPADNPFVADASARGEIWAYGLRNPWRASFDRVGGTLWVADVGQDHTEEIDIVTRGGNYGWRVLEGPFCRGSTTDMSCAQPAYKNPVAYYDHALGCSVTGGFVYRGSRLPELVGAYLYGDYCSGRIWALRYDGTTATTQVVAMASIAISSFGEDHDGEVYIVDLNGGIDQLKRPDGTQPPAHFPTTLTETGCFLDVAHEKPAPGVISYEVNSPLWADGADKRRWIALPGTSTVTYQPQGAWGFPDGTVLIKAFSLELERGDPTSRRLLETRLLVKRPAPGGWEGYTYKWNDQQTEAQLLETNATAQVVVTDPAQPGSLLLHTHYFPSRSDCLRCHTSAAGGTLGLQTGQMNRDHDFEGIIDNQLRALDHIGLFGAPLPAPAPMLPRFVDPGNPAEPLEARARSYLAGNCAQCHLPGGPTPTMLDLRYETPFAMTNTCGALPAEGDLGVMGAKIIDPGHTSTSLMWLRATRRGQDQMPPLSTFLVDDQGAGLLGQWIAALGPCP